MDDLQKIADCVRHGDAISVKEFVEAQLKKGRKAQTVLDKGLFEGMALVGQLFRDEEMFIPEVIMAAKAMQAGMDILEPLLTQDVTSGPVGTVILGTVKGDLHDLGKKLVSIMLKGAGFKVVDLGINVSADRFVEAARTERAQIVAMSALLTTTIPYMKTVIEALAEARLKDKTKTLIGGACVTQAFADTIGADAYGENAALAVVRAQQLLTL